MLTTFRLRSTAMCSAIPRVRSSLKAATSNKIESACSIRNRRGERILRMTAVSGMSFRSSFKLLSRIWEFYNVTTIENYQFLYIEPEIHHIAVLHDVFLAFDAG